jgi:electron transport complex protein RnfG
MAKLESSFKNMVLSLLGITFVASAALGLVNSATKPAIEKAEIKQKSEAIAAVLPKFDKLGKEYQAMPKDGADCVEVFPALNASGEVIANAVKTYSYSGFSGYVEIMVGFDKEGNISGYQVLKHAETPGLGSKMAEWFSNESKAKQYVIGRSLKEGQLKVSKDGGQVDAITAATITSRAFLESINRAYSVLNDQFDGVTSATKHEGE